MDDSVNAVYNREQARKVEAAVDSQKLERDKQAAVERVYSAAREAACREAENEWTKGFMCRVNGELIVLTSINMRQPLFLGSDGMIYRREEDSEAKDRFRTFRAPLMQRQRPNDILHIIKFLNRLGR